MGDEVRWGRRGRERGRDEVLAVREGREIGSVGKRVTKGRGEGEAEGERERHSEVGRRGEGEKLGDGDRGWCGEGGEEVGRRGNGEK